MFISDELKDSIWFVCSALECIAVQTDNYVSDVVRRISNEELAQQLRIAGSNLLFTVEDGAELFTYRLTRKSGSEKQAAIERGKRCYGQARPSNVGMGEIYSVLVVNYMFNHRTTPVEEAIRTVLESDLSDYLADFPFERL